MNARLGIVVMSALLLGACSGAAERPAPPSGSDTEATAQAPPDEDDDPKDAPKPTECETGETHKCKVQLPTHGSIESCYVGVNLCVDGVWSECGDEDALVQKYLGG